MAFRDYSFMSCREVHNTPRSYAHKLNLHMDARLQNLAWSTTMALIVEGTSNAPKQTSQVIMARLANVLTVVQMGFFVGYEHHSYSLEVRAAMYVSGQLCAVAADILLFYLLFHIANLCNVSHYRLIWYASRLLLFIAVLLELSYKTAACVYYVGLLYRLGYSNQVFSILRGLWAVVFFLISFLLPTSIFLNMWRLHDNGLFLTLVCKTTRYVPVIMILSIILIICGFPPVRDIPNISLNVTNVVGNSVLFKKS